MVITSLCALSTRIAMGTLDTINTFTRANSVGGANIQAFSALLTKGVNETDLLFLRETFGISAPLTG